MIMWVIWTRPGESLERSVYVREGTISEVISALVGQQFVYTFVGSLNRFRAHSH